MVEFLVPSRERRPVPAICLAYRASSHGCRRLIGLLNACSTKLEPNEIAALAENGDVSIDGVFRIWFERAGNKDDVLSEEDGVEPYTDSNPKHAIEIDPVVLVALSDPCPRGSALR